MEWHTPDHWACALGWHFAWQASTGCEVTRAGIGCYRPVVYIDVFNTVIMFKLFIKSPKIWHWPPYTQQPKYIPRTPFQWLNTLSRPGEYEDWLLPEEDDPAQSKEMLQTGKLGKRVIRRFWVPIIASGRTCIAKGGPLGILHSPPTLVPPVMLGGLRVLQCWN